MGFNWNEDQKKVIESRGKDVLVSAAAGSGKTAVLVERVVRIVSDENEPVDIDSMLLVTFTKAAAREMKGKLYKALKEASESNPTNLHLKRQLTLIGNAKVTTIDSFCSYIVKNWYFDLNLDPAMSIVDTTEIKIIKKQLLKDVIEQKLEAGEESLEKLVKAFADKGDISGLISNLLKVYEAAMNAAYPEKWIENALKLYDISTKEELNENPLIKDFFGHFKSLLAGVSDGCFELRNQLPDNDRFATPRKALGEKGNYYRALEECENLSQLAECAKNKPTSQMRYKKDLSDEEIELKEHIAKELEKLTSRAVAVTKLSSKLIDDTLNEASNLKEFAAEICDILLAFNSELNEYKSVKGLYEFLDIEHFALDILRDKNTGEVTDTARLLRDAFSYIMIDEYQDSNELQEQILTAIAKREKGKFNYFMVGDIKQSIYGFRGSEPDLFVRKLDELKGSDDGEVIYLSANYRSRDEVLKYVNVVFEKIMAKDLGGVDYDETQRLNTGRDDEKNPAFDAEVLYGILSEEDEDKEQLEAAIISNRIKELMHDDASVNYTDIVILLRSPNAYGPKLKEYLESYGIPTVMESSKGYFNRPEVAVVLAILDALDNPYNDIPLAAMLKSGLFNMTDEKLADIARAKGEASYFFDGLLTMAESGDEEVLAFLEKYKKLSNLADRNPIHELLEYIYYDMGLYYDIYSRFDGENAAANLEKLVEIALSHESGDSASLKGFIEYINVQKSYNEDTGLAGSVDGANAVRIISMHSSKGLEYPYVFVSGTGKQFNLLDTKSAFCIDKDYGFAFKFVDKKRHISKSHLYLEAIRNAIVRKTLAEEQRILYVALTRAKEKVFVTGVTKDDFEQDSDVNIYYADKYKMTSYLQWILLADAASIKVKTSMEEISKYIAEEEQKNVFTRAALESMLESEMDISKEEKLADFVYEKAADIKAKYSVSEIKHNAYEEKLKEEADGNEESVVRLFSFDEEEQIKPRFLQKTAEKSNDKIVNFGAFAGTATHRFLECFDFASDDFSTSYDSELKRMSEGGLLEKEQVRALNKANIVRFLESNEAARMHKAAKLDLLKAEQPFVMKINAALLGVKSDDETLVQGIIDVFWIENDYIVLLDYKTDKVENMDELVLRYEAQLKLYAKALEAAYGMPIKEALIYSIRLGESKDVR